MSSGATSGTAQSEAKFALWWFLGISSLLAVIVVVLFAWIDSRKVPVISFEATPVTLLAVDVRGAVTTPGVIYVEPGSRLVDVVNEAGGLSQDADHSLINLSSRVSDGQMIVLPTEVVETQSADPDDDRVDINTASAAELTQLPGIGEVLAGRIVAYRDVHGPFQSVDDLVNVEGISATTIDELRPYVRVSGDD